MVLSGARVVERSRNAWQIDGVYIGQSLFGATWYVDAGSGAAANTGLNPGAPFATIAQAISAAVASRGDVIVVAAGHTETLTAAVAMSKAGIKIVGMGRGTERPQITVNGTVDGFNITAANCEIHNIYFNEATAVATSNINIAAANTLIKGCHFDLGANPVQCITVTADGDDSAIEDNTVVITANGPDEFVLIEGAADRLKITGNIIDGGSSTNVFDDAHINAGSNTPANVLIKDNVFMFGTAQVGSGNFTPAMINNQFLRGAIPKAGVPRTIYADASASTTGDGTAEDPTTIVDAVDAAVAGDTVVLYPGTYTVTAALALDVADFTIKPVNYAPGFRQMDVEIANDTADVNTIDVTAADVHILGIKFTKGINDTVDGTEVIDIDSGGDYTVIRDCTFDMEARTNADCIGIATGTKGHIIENCMFTDLATTKSAIVWAGSAMEVKHCIFDFSAADAVFSEQIASPGDGNSFHHNHVISDDTTTAVASWQAAPGEQAVFLNYFMSVGAGNVLGGDADLDPFVVDNFRETATTPVGAGEAINPSV